MIINNLFSNIDIRESNKINQVINYLKSKEIIELKRKYDNFFILLENKEYKRKSGPSKRIEEIT
jgi:hypothetical protein